MKNQVFIFTGADGAQAVFRSQDVCHQTLNNSFSLIGEVEVSNTIGRKVFSLNGVPIGYGQFFNVLEKPDHI